MTDDAPAVSETSPAEEPLSGADWDTAARVVRLLEVVQRLAVLDFSDVAPVGDAGDDLDALAAGINMLGEELDGWNQDFNQRVAHRTAELDGSVRNLQRFNEQIGQLTEMSNLLQVADDPDEALVILGRFAPAIFAEASGALYTYTDSRELVEAVTTWGPRKAAFPPEMPPDGCRALRYGRMHQADLGETLGCDHSPPGVPGHTLCVPIAAHGMVLGLLSLHDGTDPSEQTGDRAEARKLAVRSAHERLALAASEQFALAVTNLELRNELRAQSIRDALTGLYNRRYLDETLARELRRANRTGIPVSLLMLDIDHFKQLNDTYGHAAGDAVLADVAAVVLQCVRSEDVACRYGGEEFVVIMVGLDQDEAVERAEQIRNAIALHGFTWNDQPVDRLTASFGVATSPGHGLTTDQLFGAADTALYEAKDQGRNRVGSAT